RARVPPEGQRLVRDGLQVGQRAQAQSRDRQGARKGGGQRRQQRFEVGREQGFRDQGGGAGEDRSASPARVARICNYSRPRAQARGLTSPLSTGAQEGKARQKRAQAQMSGSRRSWGLRRYLVAGVLVWLPILATVWVVT